MPATVNESGYRIGEANPLCRWSDAVVERVRRLREIEGMSYREIATTTGVPAATVKKWCLFIWRADRTHEGEVHREMSPARRAAWERNRRLRWPRRASGAATALR